MEIDLKYKIPLTGKYNAGVSDCPECNCNILAHPKHGNLYQHIIGFSDGYAIVECPECFTKWYFHARTYGGSVYDYFLEFIEEGIQKHFKK